MAPAITISHLSKQYSLGAQMQPGGMIREYLAEQVRRGFGEIFASWRNGSQHPAAEAGSFWALRDVSLDIGEGETVGIIGTNGAGKSTLLKILARITEPTEGTARLRGRLASLLEVGAGFHPELTGRENVYLQGSILGMTRAEIRSKFDQIVAFAETEKFLDTPVKRYSSGMYVRLAFAVAAHLNFEILLIDEVLAVGDLPFQTKCLKRLGEITRRGQTVLFVSHNMAAVQNLCRRVMVLQQGRMVFNGNTQDAINQYIQHAALPQASEAGHSIDLTRSTGRLANCVPLLGRLELFTDDGRPMKGVLPMGAALKACIFFHLEEDTKDFAVFLGFDNLLGQRIFTAHSCFQPGLPREAQTGEQAIVCEIPSFTLVPGEYRIKVCLEVGGVEMDSVEDAAGVTVIESDYYGTGKLPWNGAIVLKHTWHLAPK